MLFSHLLKIKMLKNIYASPAAAYTMVLTALFCGIAKTLGIKLLINALSNLFPSKPL